MRGANLVGVGDERDAHAAIGGEGAELLGDAVLLDAEDGTRAAHADEDARRAVLARLVGDRGDELLRLLDGLAADHLGPQAVLHDAELVAHAAAIVRRPSPRRYRRRDLRHGEMVSVARFELATPTTPR